MTAVFFDLDNTLYDIAQYQKSAFGEIALWLARQSQLQAQNIYQVLLGLWQEKGNVYPHLFDDLLSQLGLEKSKANQMVEIFNNHQPARLAPWPQAIPLLKELKAKKIALGIITDGHPERQKRKIKLLGLEPFFQIIILAKEIAEKPSPLPFLEALKKLAQKPSKLFYVGDNPFIDFEGAKKARFSTIRLLKGEFSQEPGNQYIDFEVKTLKQILKII